MSSFVHFLYLHRSPRLSAISRQWDGGYASCSLFAPKHAHELLTLNNSDTPSPLWLLITQNLFVPMYMHIDQALFVSVLAVYFWGICANRCAQGDGSQGSVGWDEWEEMEGMDSDVGGTPARLLRAIRGVPPRLSLGGDFLLATPKPDRDFRIPRTFPQSLSPQHSSLRTVLSSACQGRIFRLRHAGDITNQWKAPYLHWQFIPTSHEFDETSTKSHSKKNDPTRPNST